MGGVDLRAAALLEELRAHVAGDERERASLERLVEFVSTAPDPLSRTASTSHVTGSAVVASPDGRTFLLVRHRRLGRWLQPGGHVDPEDASVQAAALREAREETGAADVEPVEDGGGILDVDVHPIPAFQDRPAHVHYDVRYLATSRSEAGPGEVEEVTGVAWLTLEESLARGVDESLARSLRKAIARLDGRPVVRPRPSSGA
jgi:8-oxo-dGTP pyrophosphatase MutT (NUDIX family)